MSTTDAAPRLAPQHPLVPSARAQRVTAVVTAIVLLVSLLVSDGLRATAASNGSGSRDAGPHPSMEAEMFEWLNEERVERGLRPLVRDPYVDNVAREWSLQMATDVKLYHRVGLSTPFTGSWSGLGENVGVGFGSRSLHQAFMDSDGHRANVLGNFTSVGVGVAISDDRAWITFNFVRGDDTVASKYRTNPLEGSYANGTGWSGQILDTYFSVHDGPIQDLQERGVIVGCASYRYCPDDAVRRAEMAAMLARALDLRPATERFRDVPSDHAYADEIGALAAAGITMGCNPPANDRFCPEELVTRQQMASFFVRALDLSPTAERFADVTSSNVHHRDIGAIGASGITRGCNPPANDRYCPTKPVTRGQMASFLDRILDGS